VSVKECPHCGNIVSDRETECSCGFPFQDDGFAPTGAGAARVVGERQRKKAKKKGRFWGWGEEDSEPEPPSRSLEARKFAAAKKARASTNLAQGGFDESRLMECPFCNARISKRAPTCPKCGVAPHAKCQICDAKISSGCSVCPECGDPDPFNS